MRAITPWFVAVAMAVLLTAPAGAGTLSLSEEFPTAGEPVTVTLMDSPGDPTQYTLSATYRPNSATEKTVDVAVFGPGGALAWTPADEGIVRLAAARQGEDPAAVASVAVRFDGAPIGGLAVMLAAGFILFGGASWALRISFARK